jgi:N-acetylneuraminate synthase
MRIIAEIGSNWAKTDNQETNLDWAKKQITKASEAGATDVKFQYYTHKDLFGTSGKLPTELPESWLPILHEHCKAVKVKFLCTAFSPEGYDAVDKFVKMHKVASCEATDLDLIDYVMKFSKPVMVSTGGLKPDQIEHLIVRYPWSQLILADCVIEYPASSDQYNLCVLEEWRTMYASALSDHTFGYATALAAQGLGATIFEKHVDFYPHDGLPTPDWEVSSNYFQFSTYCNVLKKHELPKLISPSEAYNVKMSQRRKTANGFYRPMPRYIDDETQTSQKEQASTRLP